MGQSTFETFVRRASYLLNRRSLFGGMSAAFLAAGVPLTAKAKGKHHHHHHNGKSKGCQSLP
jgi:hypothetical protein